MNEFLFRNLEPLTAINLTWYLLIYVGFWSIIQMLENFGCSWILKKLNDGIQASGIPLTLLQRGDSEEQIGLACKSRKKGINNTKWLGTLEPLLKPNNKTKITIALVLTILIIYIFKIGIKQ